MVTDLLVRRVYRSYGISIAVEIDYVNKSVTLIDRNGDPKPYVFEKRTPEYLNGWRAIMKAMEYAVEQAQNELTKAIDEEHEEFVKMWAQLDKGLDPKQGDPDKKGDIKP